MDEREDLKLIIQSNIYNYLGILLEGREWFEEESVADRRKTSQCDPSSSASREYAPLVDELWKDPAIQATYRRSELPFLPPVASYFLDKVVDISQTEYELSDMDILYADGITSSDGVASTEFSFPQLSLGGLGIDEPDAQDTLLRSVLPQRQV